MEIYPWRLPSRDFRPSLAPVVLLPLVVVIINVINVIIVITDPSFMFGNRDAMRGGFIIHGSVDR